MTRKDNTHHKEKNTLTPQTFEALIQTKTLTVRVPRGSTSYENFHGTDNVHYAHAYPAKYNETQNAKHT